MPPVGNFAAYSSPGEGPNADSQTTTRAREAEALPPLSPALQAARADVLARLDAAPTIRSAFVNRFEGDVMILTLAVRGVGTCELAIPSERFSRSDLGDYDALAASVTRAEGMPEAGTSSAQEPAGKVQARHVVNT